jgi:hypothetical protein
MNAQVAAAVVALAAAGVESQAFADPIDADHALVLRIFVAVHASVGPRRDLRDLDLEATPRPVAPPCFDWLSPVFVWIEPGYAFAKVTFEN